MALQHYTSQWAVYTMLVYSVACENILIRVLGGNILIYYLSAYTLTAATAAQKAQYPRIHSPTEESISHLLEETQSTQSQYSAISTPMGE